MLDLATIRALNDKRDDSYWRRTVAALCDEVERLQNAMSAKDAAALLHVSRRRVMALIEEDRLSAWKRGQDWYIDRRTIDAYAASPRKAGRPRRTNG
jgi:excisionase family DNA binding protein